jgi:hypothetical protein
MAWLRTDSRSLRPSSVGASTALLNAKPEVWLSTSRTRIGCCGFFSTVTSSSWYAMTFWPLNSGRYFSTGSSMLTLPSSTSIMSAVPVIGLVCDAIQNIVSGVIGFLVARSA